MAERAFPWLGSARVGAARVPPPAAGASTDKEHLEAWYEPAAVRQAVAQALWRMRGGDAASGNPLAGLVRPGDRVVLKPNLIRQSALSSDEWRHVITHPAVVAAVLDLAAGALAGRGEVAIADGPQTDSSFQEISRRTGLPQVAAAATARHGVPVELVDLRQEEWTSVDGVMVDRRPLPGDPAGYVDVNLGPASEFMGHTGEGRYYGAAFDTAETNEAHQGRIHRYRLSGTVMACDVLINLPKLKTHKKAGITCSLKNLVGVNGNKNWLPHYTLGLGAGGSDQYPAPSAARRLEGALLRGGKALLARHPSLARTLLPAKRVGRAAFGDTGRVVRSGNWHGNDTLWRMVLDLNRAVLWYDASGGRRPEPRRTLSVVDAVIMGQGRGPEDPDPAPAGWLLAGASPVAVDAVAADLMGFSWEAIPAIREAFAGREPHLAPFPPEAVRLSCGTGREHRPGDLPAGFAVPARPHFGWAGHIERAPAGGAP